MSNVLRFLEQAGRVGYDKAKLNSEISALDTDLEVRRAIQNGDLEVLAASLGGRGTMRCFVFSPD